MCVAAQQNKDLHGKLLVDTNVISVVAELDRNHKNYSGHGPEGYLRACGILDGGMSAFWCPGNALHYMFVFPELSFTLFGSHDPHAHSLVIGATGNECAVLVRPHHTNPLSVACEGLHTVADAQERWYVMVLNRKPKGRTKKSAYPVATSHIFMVLSLEAETM